MKTSLRRRSLQKNKKTKKSKIKKILKKVALPCRTYPCNNCATWQGQCNDLHKTKWLESSSLAIVLTGLCLCTGAIWSKRKSNKNNYPLPCFFSNVKPSYTVSASSRNASESSGSLFGTSTSLSASLRRQC